jgi:hypothetical protein
MTEFLNFLTALVSLAIVLGIAWLLFFRKKAKKKKLRIADTPAVVVAINKIAGFATACFFEEKIFVEKKAAPIVDNKLAGQIAKMAHKDALIEDELCIIAKGLVRAGYDLRKLTADDLEIDSGTVTLRLPKVTILEVIINPSGWDFYVENGTWNDDQIKAIKSKAKEAIREDAIENGILDKARQSGERKIEALLVSLGFKKVIFS